MKKLVWLLFAINLGLLAYFNLDKILPNAQKVAVAEIHPEKISTLSPEQISALPKKVVEPPPKPVVSRTLSIETPPVETNTIACYEWGKFDATQIFAAKTAIAKLALKAKINEPVSQKPKQFWVYKPPLKSPEAAQAKVLELSALGITDVFVIPDTKWKNAISFGVFDDEHLAAKLLSELKAKGVREVLKAVREPEKEPASFIFNKLNQDNAAKLQALTPEFPNTNVKEITCE